jgi:peptide/nickel transport system substrate-binding protein
VLIPQLTEVRMMSKSWSTKHNVLKPQDYKNKEETYASRNANGTGPYIVRSREADVKTVAVANSNWWGKREGNVDEVIYQPIKQDSTRLAALLSGEIDFVLDPSPQDIPRLKQDPKMKIVEGNENRTIFFGMDQWRDELQYSSVKGKNPFKYKRVR